MAIDGRVRGSGVMTKNDFHFSSGISGEDGLLYVPYADVIKSIENYKDKYHWHDLRKNPEDLPDEYVHVLVCVGNGKSRQYNRSWHDGRGWWNATSKSRRYYEKKSVVAWRYIEPFEEVT